MKQETNTQKIEGTHTGGYAHILHGFVEDSKLCFPKSSVTLWEFSRFQLPALQL